MAGKKDVPDKEPVSTIGEALTEAYDEQESAGVLGPASRTGRSRGFEILVNEEILEERLLDSSFAQFLTTYLEGKPRWLT